MDFTLSTLGFTAAPMAMLSPTRSKRKYVTAHFQTLPKSQQIQSNELNVEDELLSNKRRQSVLMQFIKQAYFQPQIKSVDSLNDDDETASTVSISTSSDSDCFDEDSYRTTASRAVRFAEPLVTQVQTRPRTTKEDKYYMHYSDVDYMDFKIGYVTGKERTRKVGFARDVVSQVEVVPSRSEQARANLYYSEDELQCFLDEFVKSLNS